MHPSVFSWELLWAPVTKARSRTGQDPVKSGGFVAAAVLIGAVQGRSELISAVQR
jgi:hypothetical protein